MIYETEVSESTSHSAGEMMSAIEAVNTAQRARYEKTIDIKTKHDKIKQVLKKGEKERKADADMKAFKDYISLGSRSETAVEQEEL